MKPHFNKVFWIINNEMFKPKLKTNFLDKKTEDDLDYIRYKKIIPVYVFSQNELHDGTTTFDITPVNVIENPTACWQWRRSVEDKDIGKTVFENKDDAIKVFEKEYSTEQRQLFSEKDEFRRLQK